ncbi:MAG: hypothetical protein KDD12_25615, partial [Lewinella sp.]|nr:hypothetical protein [Lewinella sp.]
NPPTPRLWPPGDEAYGEVAGRSNNKPAYAEAMATGRRSPWRSCWAEQQQTRLRRGYGHRATKPMAKLLGGATTNNNKQQQTTTNNNKQS